jgi:chromosome segregation ATPase
MDDAEDNPALAAAQQQMQAMGQEMEQMHQMLQNVGKSIEMQEQRRKDYEADIKAFQAETQRISAIQASMSPEQIQDIAVGTIHSMINSGDLMAARPEVEQSEPRQMPGMPESTEGMQQ